MAARTFGQSPARTYLGLTDPYLVTAIDEALALRLLALQSSEKSKLPPGMRYATDADEFGDDEDAA